jgi:hypothetical protein
MEEQENDISFMAALSAKLMAAAERKYYCNYCRKENNYKCLKLDDVQCSPFIMPLCPDYEPDTTRRAIE